MTTKSLSRAFDQGARWIGWGKNKGCPLRVIVHACPVCGPVEVCGIDEVTAWLRANATRPDACWEGTLQASLRIDQLVWTHAYQARENAERALRLLDAGAVSEALAAAAHACSLSTEIAANFNPWGSFWEALTGQVARR